MNKPVIEPARENFTNVFTLDFFAPCTVLLSAILAACMLGYVLLLTFVMIGNMP